MNRRSGRRRQHHRVCLVRLGQFVSAQSRVQLCERAVVLEELLLQCFVWWADRELCHPPVGVHPRALGQTKTVKVFWGLVAPSDGVEVRAVLPALAIRGKGQFAHITFGTSQRCPVSNQTRLPRRQVATQLQLHQHLEQFVSGIMRGHLFFLALLVVVGPTASALPRCIPAFPRRCADHLAELRTGQSETKTLQSKTAAQVSVACCAQV